MQEKTQRQEDRFWMQEAIQRAEKAVLLAPPNPAVGAVIVRDGVRLGRGHTQQVGGPHAEIMAMRNAIRRGHHDLTGSTIYVTLEPCSHYGRTPPCACALIRAKVGRVVYATMDPNPQVAGRGLAMLRRADVVVDGPCCQERAQWVNRGFLYHMRTGRPWVRLKIATTMDGFIALPDGRSQWITARRARFDNQRMRGRAGAVVTGMGTMLADHPSMNVRLPDMVRQPIRVVLDTHLRMTMDRPWVAIPGEKIIYTTQKVSPDVIQAWAEHDVRVVTVGSVQNRVDVQAVLLDLGRRQVHEVHLEAGAILSGAMLDAGAVQEICFYQAPCFFGQGLSALRMTRPTSPSRAFRWRVHSTRKIGQDIRTILQKE